MSLYTRARKHIDMKRVKEMREEKIKREKIAEILRQQEEIRAELEYIESQESKYVDWRRDLENLNETMTTSGLGMINLPAEGNVDIIDTSTTFDNLNSGLSQMDNYSRSGTTVTLQGTENQIVGGTHTFFNVARYEVDGTRVSHVKITISKGGGTSSWTDRDGASNFDDSVTLNITDADDFFAPLYNDPNLTSGTHVIAVPGHYKNLRISFEQFGKVGETGALRITNVSLQRRTPVNVFVSLDDPEANSFIRDGIADKMSPAEKKKKLEEQLNSSEEYLNKMFGGGMPKGATTIADYEPQQSFMDIQVGDQRVTKVNNRTVTDTTRGIKDGKMDGTPVYTDSQGNMRVGQPKPKSVPFTGLSPEDLKSISDRVGGSYSGTSDRTSITNVPTPTKSAVPRLYQNKSAEYMGGSIQHASTTMKNGEGFLKDQFRGTDVSVPKLMSLGKELARLNNMIGRGTGSVEQLQRAIDLRNNTQEKIKAEIEGGKPDLKPVAQAPKSSDNQAELEKNIEASLKQLEIDNKQLKGDALKRNLGLAVDLGLDILTVVTLLTPIPGDEAAALTAQAAKAGVKTGAKNVSQKAVQTSLKKNAYNNIADDVADDAARATADLLMNKARYGDDALKYVQKLDDAAASGNTGLVQKIIKEIDKLDPLRRFNKPSVPKPSVPKPSPRTNPGGAYPRNSPMRPKNTPQGTLGNSYQPQGKVIKEKKSFKDLKKKIPGYYDGKPSPLGFPVEEPPKMVNGYHPDLVDGKKVANRFNRLDPISARAMPKTGNPHIDKKVRAAAVSEQMTSSGTFFTTLPAAGDVDLQDITEPVDPGTPGSGGTGAFADFGNYDETGNGGFSIVLDTRKFDTLKFSASRGNATRIELAINGGSFSTLSSGTNTITISAANRTSSTRFVFNAFKSDGSGSTGASISGTAFQRRLPVNAFVGLDDPDASSFVRGGLGGDKERRKTLKDMLESGNKWMTMNGLEPSKTSPGDIEIASARGPYGTPGADKPYVRKGYKDKDGKFVDFDNPATWPRIPKA